jgi:hypothetical protein
MLTAETSSVKTATFGSLFFACRGFLASLRIVLAMK